MKKKLLSVALATIVAVMAISGASLAWLQDTSDTVTNTFTEGKVDIELTETGTTNNEKSYKMVPGDTLSKDPTVIVKAVSEACWLFVKVQEINNVDTFLSYAIAEGWHVLSGENTAEMIIYREVADSNEDQPFAILNGNQVTVKQDVEMDDMEALATNGKPQLKFTAYAIQSANITDTDEDGTAADEAWTFVKP